MRSIEQIREDAYGCRQPELSHQELLHLLAIAEAATKRRVPLVRDELQDELDAARAAGLFGDVEK